MKNDKAYIIANWKLGITNLADAKRLFTTTKKTANTTTRVQTILCPPPMYLEPLSQLVTGHRCALGAQDIFYEDQGSAVGEISGKMLADRKIGYSILGHSSRRARGESSDDVAGKVQSCLRNSIIPIVCIGEVSRGTEEEPIEPSIYLAEVEEQVIQSFGDIPKTAFGNIIITYEPVWAISANEGSREATPDDAREMIVYIKKVLADEFDLKKTDHLTFVYGGSVDVDNISNFIHEDEINGVLVGSASRDADEFTSMLEESNEIMKEK